MKKMLLIIGLAGIISLTQAASWLERPFLIGVGGITCCPTKKGEASSHTCCSFTAQRPIYQFLKKEVPNANAFSVWITRTWQPFWYPAKIVQKGIDRGYTPIFIFYWFADEISETYVRKHRKAYFKTLKKFADYLQTLKGEKIVILNPEYNENGVERSRMFDFLQAESILYLKEHVKNVRVGVCPGDFGNYDKIWDEQNWEIFRPSLQESAKVADFIAFQEMRALTRNKPEQIRKTPYRALAFATYLHQTYHKPTFLAYLAVSSHKNPRLQQEVIARFVDLMPIFRHGARMLGFNLFHYIDVPGHKGYFNEAESHFGIKKADGSKKPSFKPFLKLK